MNQYGKDAILMADTFDVLAQAFLVSVAPQVGPGAIDYKTWQKGYEVALDLKKTVEKARSASRIEQLEIGAKISAMSFPFYALDIFGDMVEVRQLAADGQSQLGAESFDAFTDTGKLPDVIDRLIFEGLSVADVKISGVQGAIAKATEKAREEYARQIDEYKTISGFRERARAITSIQQEYATERDAMYESMQSGDITIDAYYKWAEESRAELKEKLLAYTDAYNRDMEKIGELEDQCNKTIAEETKELSAQLEKYIAIQEKAQDVLYKEVIKDIASSSQVTKDDATAWADAQDVTKPAQKRLKTMGYPVDQLRKDMAEFYRLCGGRLGKTDIVTKGHRRACAAVNSAIVYLDGNFNKRTLFHEMGHLLEVHPKIKAAANRFLELRTGKSGVTKLSKITGNKGYRGSEKAYEDHFIHPYVGKKYDDGITEVMSMGFQCFANAKEISVLAEKDPEMMSLIVGIMKTPISETESQISGKTVQAAEKEKSAKAENERFYKELDKKAANVLEAAKLQGFFFDSYRGPKVKNPNRFTAVTPDGKMLPVFTKEKHLKRFMYLFLTSVSQVGWTTAWREKYELAQRVVNDQIPTAIVGKPGEWQIEDLKDSVFSEVPR